MSGSGASLMFGSEQTATKGWNIEVSGGKGVGTAAGVNLNTKQPYFQFGATTPGASITGFHVWKYELPDWWPWKNKKTKECEYSIVIVHPFRKFSAALSG
jgi:hypothetical protein